MCHRGSIMVFVLMALAIGCEGIQYDLTKATRPYPTDLHRAEAIDIQVFREGNSLEIINSTPHSYRDFDLWINQRYVRHVELMAAGELIRLSLEEFYDERGEVLNAGGPLTSSAIAYQIWPTSDSRPDSQPAQTVPRRGTGRP